MNTMVQTHAHGADRQGDTSWGRTLAQCARATLALCIVTGMAYPLLTTVVAKGVFPHAAEGSLIRQDGRVVGSELLGQSLTSARYFQGRPSVTSAPDPKNEGATISAPYNAALSAASNQGSTSKALADAVAERVAAYRQLNGMAADAPVPVDAVTASASGLDPHISVANAKLQAARVAKERTLPQDVVARLVENNTDRRDLWLLGEPRVNVLALNLALDALGGPAVKGVKE